MYIGIDSCKYGWCVAYGEAMPLIELYSSIQDVEKLIRSSTCALIDIPIGLPDQNHPRSAERCARMSIPHKSSSIFNVPSLQAAYADSYEEAKELNKLELGKSISKQSWNIAPKIREVDEFISKKTVSLKEAHPELCFHYLSEGIGPLESKKGKIGIDQRLEILEDYVSEISETFNQAIFNYQRKDVAPDDIVDALCLWLSAHLTLIYPMHSVTTNEKDCRGVSMNMQFVDPFGKNIETNTCGPIQSTMKSK